ncbi:MAG TPA: hypothetical protein VHL78_05500 [Actinomycetota bacterium]|nr:hypothetical protein [Actinomycetota bacterium]
MSTNGGLTTERGRRPLVSALGEASLSGIKGKVARPVASAASRRTRFREDQIRAAIGLVFLGLSLYALISTVRRALELREE